MVVNTHMIGLLKAVRKVEIDGFVDGEWKTELPKVELTVMSESLDLDNQMNISVDKIIMEDKHYNKYNALTNEVVAVPYRLDVTKKGQKWEYDESMPIVELKESFINLIKVDKTAETKK